MASLAPSHYGHVEAWGEWRDAAALTSGPGADEVNDPREKSLFRERPRDAGAEASRRGGSEPRPAAAREQRLCLAKNHRELGKHQAARWEDETETSFGCHDRTHASPARNENGGSVQSSSAQLHEEDYLELFMLADQELGSEKSVDYGFIMGVVCLVTGISLVVISYAVPRDVSVDPDSVSAREMESHERENARVGAHLDRCVIAGLCLLTLGGVVLAMLLMVSMWKWESMRRKAFAYSKHAAKLYGSINLRGGPAPLQESPSHLSTDLEALR